MNYAVKRQKMEKHRRISFTEDRARSERRACKKKRSLISLQHVRTEQQTVRSVVCVCVCSIQDSVYEHDKARQEKGKRDEAEEHRAVSKGNTRVRNRRNEMKKHQ